MIPNTSTVGTEGNAGAEGTPSQPVSQNPSTPIESDVTKLLAGFGERFDTLQKELRGLQGRQDRADNNFQSQLAKFNQIKTQGNLSDAQAMEVMERGDAEAQRWAALEKKLDGLAERIGGAGTQSNGQQLDVTKVFESYKLDPRDPRVAPLLVKKYETQEQAELAALKLQWDISQSPNPTAAQGASMTGGNSGFASSNEEKAVRLQELYKTYSQNIPEIESIEKDLRASGYIR
jgi:hypothetical protein